MEACFYWWSHLYLNQVIVSSLNVLIISIINKDNDFIWNTKCSKLYVFGIISVPPLLMVIQLFKEKFNWCSKGSSSTWELNQFTIFGIYFHHFCSFSPKRYTYTQKVRENPHPPITMRVVEEGKSISFNKV